ncbi:MAG TPA: TonB-dependent receptor [Bacteroidales bacterium]|nr:TonB-dependent receptor [Bacteroidales bacterium]HPS17715.1 TonB-dependent receptor [Bacteroidales bacterium]
MKKKFAVLAFCIALYLPMIAQVTIKGVVSDAESKSILTGATVKIGNSFNTGNSLDDGSYIFKNVKKGNQKIEVSYVGYETWSQCYYITRDTVINVLMKKKTFLADELVIKAIRADENAPVTSTKLEKNEIENRNMGQDITYMMSMTPSVVVTSDAGTGVGYTGIRIRGTDPTRINVTINGIPTNDAESQGTYWVDFPDIVSSVDNMQIQRGVGSSTNGAGAFGASLNIQTSKLNENPYATISSSLGSFNTYKNTFSAGSGLINKCWAFDARLSKLYSDGFIDRAFSDLKSFYVSGGYYGKKSILKLIVFSGKERTYQAWYGVPEARLKNDYEGMQQMLDNWYITQAEYDAMINSDSRTYNYYTYSNQTDNYQQDNYQLHYSYEINKNWNANAALHLTKGAGYYEEFKNDDALNKYGLDSVIIGQDTITSTDLVRQRWLDNDFYGVTYSLNYDSRKKFLFTIGGAANKYDGEHYGMVTWAQYASNGLPDKKYYSDNAIKNDVDIFGKLNYHINKKLNFYADLQYRTIYYSFFGYDDDLQNVQQAVNLNFFNPKVGIVYKISPSNDFYISNGIGNKEPCRDDYVQSTPANRPKPEHLQNLETGISHTSRNWKVAANYYYMYYTNQLVLTGQINDVGEYNRTNIDKSYRTGVEIEAGIKPVKKLNIEANATFSKNIILDFTEYVDNWDDWSQVNTNYSETDIAFSPRVIAGSQVEYEFYKNAFITLLSKYVGRQYLDNTSNPDRAIDSYFVNDIGLAYSIYPKFMKEIKFTLLVNNVLSEEYESNGWTYPYYAKGKLIKNNYYYPQAGRNYLAGITMKF